MKKGIYLKKGEVKILMRATNYNEAMLAIEEIKKRRIEKEERKRRTVKWKERVIIETLIETLEKENAMRPSADIALKLEKLKAHI